MWDNDYATFVSIWPSGGDCGNWLSRSPAWLFLLPRLLFALQSIFLSVRSFPYLRWPEVYPFLSIYLLCFLGCSVSFVLLFHFPTLFSSFFFRFEIYDDARTRALASSDYVYDLIEGSRTCGRKCSCTPLYNLLIYKISTVPYRTLISDSAPVLLVEASCFVACIFPHIAEVGFEGWRIRSRSR